MHFLKRELEIALFITNKLIARETTELPNPLRLGVVEVLHYLMVCGKILYLV